METATSSIESTALTSAPSRARRTNQLYEEWKNATPEEKTASVERLYIHLRLYALRLLWSILHREDAGLIHDIATDVIERLNMFKGESLFSTWVHACIRHRIIDRMRSERKFVSLDSITEEEEHGVTEEALDRHIYLKERLDTLPHSDVLRQFLIDGKTPQQIGEDTGTSARRVQQIIKEAHESAALHDDNGDLNVRLR